MSAPVDPLSAVPEPLFLLGRIVATPGALHLMQRTATAPEDLLMRHVTGDWGEICAEDAEQNQLGIEHGFRIMSVYRLPLQDRAEFGAPSVQSGRFYGTTEDSDVAGWRIWIITEADRSCSTLLRPRDY